MKQFRLLGRAALIFSIALALMVVPTTITMASAYRALSNDYEEEQKELSEKIKKLRSEIEKQSSRATSTDMFVSIVRKYTRARKLTPRMLNELVEKIEVYNAEKIDGEWVQRLRIHYNCVGEMNIPNEPALPIPAVTVNTRKGVFVSYTTDDRPAV